MSDTRHKWNTAKSKRRGCLDKVPYGKREARRRARMLTDKGDPCHAYPCLYDHPGRWHVGADWSS